MESAIVYLHELNFVSVPARLLCALAVGFSIGYGRTRKQRATGLRTYMLTSMGAALAVILSLYEYRMLQTQWAPIVAEVGLKFDGARIAGQTIAGIGFLAAGTIIAVDHHQVKGLTSAIGLFGSVCLGIAAGAGFYTCVLTSLVLFIIAMEPLRPLEVAFKRHLRNITIYVEFSDDDDLDKIIKVIHSMDAEVFEQDREKNEEHPGAILALRLAKDQASHSAMLSTLAELPYVHAVQELIS